MGPYGDRAVLTRLESAIRYDPESLINQIRLPDTAR
jgi:hypothetical protein